MYLKADSKVVFLLFLVVTVGYGSTLRDEYKTTTFEPEVNQDEADATTIGLRFKRQVGLEQNEILPTSAPSQDQADDGVTDKLQDEVFLETTVVYRSKREVVVTEAPQGDDGTGTTLDSIARDEVVTESIQSDEGTGTTSSSRTKREAIELVTESIGSNEIFNDATETSTDSPNLRSKSEKSSDDFKYPTPYPDVENSTALPPDFSDDLPRNVTKDAIAQSIIAGNLTCKCGTPLTRIVGGVSSKISDLPWTVALIRKSNTTTKRGPYCGGTLVSDRYIATASHCVDGFEASEIEVWLNEEDFRVEDENLSGTIRVDVEKIIMHPDYNRRTIDNDIALLKLAEPMDIEKVLRPACLPADNSKTFENEEGIVAGWGAKEQGGSVSATLQKVSVPILANKVCNWRTFYLGKITDNQLCAGELSGNKDSCQGDSGGPLVAPRGGEYAQQVLVGIVSYGYGCAKPLAPGVYTRTSRYPAWIIKNSPDALYCSE